MFGGVTHLNLDPKNRLAIPARYREILQQSFGGRVVVTLESPQCILLYPEANWVNIREKIQNLSTGSHPLVKSYQRLVLGYAESIEIDKAGRILIPATLKKLAELDKETVLVGLGNRFEIWDKIKWDAETSKALQLSQDDLAVLLNGFSL
jgi:MraZ protein